MKALNGKGPTSNGGPVGRPLHAPTETDVTSDDDDHHDAKGDPKKKKGLKKFFSR